MRGETAIEKHLRLQKQADELAQKIDFNVCSRSSHTGPGSDAGLEIV